MIKKKGDKKTINDGVKKITQDVNLEPNGRRSIRDIPIPTNGGVLKKRKATRKIEEPSEIPVEPEIFLDNLPKDKSKYFLWGIVFISIVVLVFAVSSLFSGSTVTITPKQQRVTLNDTFVATNEVAANNLQYQVIQISDTASKVVESDAEEFVEQKSSGSIVVYNAHSSTSQRLIAQTRFETPDGKIYRIQEGVTVPGMSNEKPGQLEVTVYADQPGADYNVGLTDFKIPGFEGDSRYDDFYARSKTAMTGGFSGMQPIINEDTKAQAEVELKELIKKRLSDDLKTRISENLIIPENSIFYTFESLPSTKNDAGSVELVYKGTLSSLSLSASGLASKILEKTAEKTDLQVKVDNLNELSIKLRDSETFGIVSKEQANIEISGDALLVWSIDEEQIKKDLAGAKKKDLSEVLSSYDEIGKAKAVIRPFWKSTFPTEISKIKVKIVLD